MSSTVHVKGISSQTTEKEVRDFFSFCGKIQSLSVTKESNDASAAQSASVTFEKETAAKTALLLDNTQLGPSQVHVSAASNLDEIAGGKTVGSADESSKDDIDQEDKPRSRVAAEMLAHGYNLSDSVIQRALALDQQHGISNRFSKALTDFDAKYKVSERAQQADKSYGVSARADAGWRGLNSYFEKALGTPTGQRVRAFYEQGQKQVLDVHNEAMHLAALKSGKPQGAQHSGSTTSKTAEEAEMEKVTIDGKERTKCNCAGNEGGCPCTPGECACTGCAKSEGTATPTTA